MGEGSFNVQEIARQLGLKDIRELPIIRAIQLTIPASDSSTLGPPLLAPEAWFGGLRVAVAAQRGGIQVHSLGAGGCWITEVHFKVASSSIQGFRFTIEENNPLAGDPLAIALAGQQMGPTDVLSTVNIGVTTTPFGSDEVPTLGAGVANGTQEALVKEFFVPRGRFFTLVATDVLKQVEFAIRVRDVPAAALTPTG